MDLIHQYSMHEDFHQSVEYAKVMEKIGWMSIPIDGNFIFVRKLGPISFAKFQRPSCLDLEKIEFFCKKLSVFSCILEPALKVHISDLKTLSLVDSKDQIKFNSLAQKAHFKKVNHHFSYSKTAIIDLQKEYLSTFPAKTRYNIGLSAKKNIEYLTKKFSMLTLQEKNDFYSLHTAWSKERKIIGFSNEFLSNVFDAFGHKGELIMAFKEGELAGALMVFVHDRIAYYYYTCTLSIGLKLHVPTGLTHHALLFAVEKKCLFFDFCSVYDERYPDQNIRWKGFTEFKSRFAPVPIYYPPSYSRRSL